MIDDVVIVVNPEKISIELSDDVQSIFVHAESISVQVNSLLSIGNSVFVIGEIPTGAINGQNATFTALQNFVPLSVDVILNSTVQTYGTDYVTTGSTIIILNVAPVSGDILRLNYKLG